MSSMYVGKNKNTGEPVSFCRKWGQKEFSINECERLANGETISFPYKSSSGREFSELRGKLIMQTHEGHTFLGFAPAWKYECPPGFSGVTFTDEEKNILESGGIVTRNDFKSLKTGQNYSAKVKLDYSTGKPKISIEGFMHNSETNKTRIKLGSVPENKNPFVDELYKASHDGLTENEYRDTQKKVSPSLTSGKIDVSKVTLDKVIKSPNTEHVTLLYSNGVLVYIDKNDYEENKDYIQLCSIDEVIKEYAFNVDASAIE